MAAEVEIAHLSPGRLRLRVAGHKADRDFFEHLQTSLARCPGVSELRVNPYTGSVLIYHESTTGEIMEYGRSQELFVPAVPKPRPGPVPSHAALKAFMKIDSQLRDRTAGNWDLRELAFLALSVGGLIQTARQKFMPAGFTLFWYATGLLQQKFRHNNLQM